MVCGGKPAKSYEAVIKERRLCGFNLMRSKIIIFAFLALIFPAVSFADVCAINTGSTAGAAYMGRPTSAQNAQAFTVTSTCTVTAVGFAIAEAGGPSDNVTVAIYSASGGTPSTQIGAGGTIAGGTIAGSEAHATSTFSGPTLSPATTYFLYVSRSGGISDSDYYATYNTTSAAFGNEIYFSSGWNDAGGTLKFEIDGIISGGGGSASSTPLILSQQEGLYIWGVFLFFFTIPFWEKVLTIRKPRAYDI